MKIWIETSKKERKKLKLTKRKGLRASSVEKRKEGIGGGVEQRNEGEIRRRIGRLHSTPWEEIWVENLPRIHTRGRRMCVSPPPPHVCKSMCAFYIYREMWFIFWNFDLLKGFEIYTTIILLGQRWDKWCAYGRSPEQILIDCRERGWKHKTFTLHVSDRLSQTTAHTGKSQRLKPCINIIGNKKQGQGDCWITLQASYLSHHCLIRAS